ncbi:Alpha/Beta hydrolase protein [Piptocephalis cylindrospora]|uniref:Alpha/Beta hydrolase protein n=1 Tax=Piptocephalis cylindrospora TaxID=1907219 RepID=A0A4P9Y2A2_9FUNG|nr:Alpha/Beta hydrolase protein [Piptocephalis cylindrospora]|eukprot:RKP12945.1 Alpha/Beta hydrolase protein [Piptocephalis cylindrospora]
MLELLYYLLTSPVHFVLSAFRTIVFALFLTLPSLWHAKQASQAAKGIYHDLPYADVGGEARTLDIYLPHSPSHSATREGFTERRAPILIYIQDTGWTHAKKEAYASLALALRSHGILCIVPNFRTYPTIKGQTLADDVTRVIRWSLANAKTYGGDPTRMSLVAHSTGLQLCLHALSVGDPIHRSLVHLIGLSGIYDLPALYGHLGRAGSYRATALLRTFDVPVISGLNRFSPIHLVPVLASLDAPPGITLIHGSRDSVMPTTQLSRFVERLRARSLHAKMVLLQGWTRTRFTVELLGHRTPTDPVTQVDSLIHAIVTPILGENAPSAQDMDPDRSILLADHIQDKPYLWRMRQWILELWCPL